ncbi:MAG: hypothetical protein FJZ56_02505 [Chlamydiae bacterium]|nr:hypothetical protein [Chlamydiota bacterium]
MSDEIRAKSIEDATKIDRTAAIGASDQQNITEAGKFASYMQENPNVSAPKGPGPMQIAEINPAAQTSQTMPTVDSVRSQITTASSSLGDINNQLNTQNLKLKQSQKYLLRSKLENANDNIRGAVEKLGGDAGDPVNLRTKKNPIAKFLTLVSDGQQQLTNAANLVSSLNASGQEINPAKLLLVQVKLQKAQQELDYTSVILGKAVDVIKTLFNVQI